MSHSHDYEATGAVQTTWLNMECTEREEYKCKECPKRLWLPTGTTPPSKKASSPKDSGARVLPNQLSLIS